MHYTIQTIADVSCVFTPMKDTPSTTISVFVKAGSMYETKEQNGLAHLLEHMFFAGGEKYPNSKAVAEAVDSFGGEMNAFTDTEYTGYYIKAPLGYETQAIDILADMLVHPTFPYDELEKEKQVIAQEIAMYDDDPQSLVYDKWQQRRYGDSARGRPILGTLETLRTFRQEDLLSYHEMLYTKDNIVISVAGGGANSDIVFKKIADTFDDLTPKRSLNEPLFDHILPLESQSHFIKDTQQQHLILSANGFRYTENEIYPAKVVMTILGGNMSSRLYQNIRVKHGLCYYITAGHSASTHDGVFLIRAGMEKERFEFGLQTIMNEIEQLVQQGCTQEEFINAKGYLTGHISMGLESSNSVSHFVGKQLLLYNEVKTLDDLQDLYDNVMFDDIYEVMQQLKTEKIFGYWVGK